jgi:hypothetical protein
MVLKHGILCEGRTVLQMCQKEVLRKIFVPTRVEASEQVRILYDEEREICRLYAIIVTEIKVTVGWS